MSNPNYWLMKSEPTSFSFDALVKSKHSTNHWDGVRNYQARNNLRAMRLAVSYTHLTLPTIYSV